MIKLLSESHYEGYGSEVKDRSNQKTKRIHLDQKEWKKHTFKVATKEIIQCTSEKRKVNLHKKINQDTLACHAI
jgi:hypothetical protein